MVTVLGPKEINKLSKEERKEVINTTSTSRTWSRGLSPFLLGPITMYAGYVSQNFENLWQYSKVYPEHVGALNLPTEEWIAWAQDGWNKKEAVRYPMGKGRKPLYSYWNGKQLDYIQARKEIYLPYYIKAVKKTSAFAQLEREYYNKERKLILFDFDAYDHRVLGMNYEDVLNCEEKKMGHGFCLAMLLDGYIE